MKTFKTVNGNNSSLLKSVEYPTSNAQYKGPNFWGDAKTFLELSAQNLLSAKTNMSTQQKVPRMIQDMAD